MNLKKCLASLSFVLLGNFLVFDANAGLEDILKNEKLSNNDVQLVKGILSKDPKNTIKSFLSVIKNNEFPDRSRWLSVLLVGQSMGKKSSPLMVRYLEHPNWMIRSAAIKSLKSLRVSSPISAYQALLKDKSYVIRQQVLDTISTLEIKSMKFDVLKMLGDSSNYIKTKNGNM